MSHFLSKRPNVGSSSRIWSVVLTGVLLTIAFVLLSALRLWRDRQADMEQWQAHMSDTSLTLAEHVRQTFTAADLVLKSVADHVNDAGIQTEANLREALATQHIYEMLRDRAASAPQISVATIVAMNGDVVNFTRSWPPAPINLADRDYFKAHLADPSLDVFLSIPVRNRGTGTWTFYFARKIKAANQTLVRAVLEKMGHSVQVVSDGAEALEALKQASFDVVLMDVQMPHVDGYEATRRIRQLEGTISTIPIIGVTAYARDADRRAVLDCGMNEYVSKPFRLVTLAAALHKVTETPFKGISPTSTNEPEVVAEAEFDATVLDTLLAAVGAETFSELLVDFKSTVDMLLERLQTALASGDEQTIRSAAHRLIGVVGQFGGLSVSRAARVLEFAPADQLQEQAKDLIARCRRLEAVVL